MQAIHHRHQHRHHICRHRHRHHHFKLILHSLNATTSKTCFISSPTTLTNTLLTCWALSQILSIWLIQAMNQPCTTLWRKSIQVNVSYMLLFEQVRPFTFKNIQIFPPTISFRCQSLSRNLVWKSDTLVASWEQGIFNQDHFNPTGVPNNRLKDQNNEWVEERSATQMEACFQKDHFESIFPKSESVGAVGRAPFWLL